MFSEEPCHFIDSYGIHSLHFGLLIKQSFQRYWFLIFSMIIRSNFLNLTSLHPNRMLEFSLSEFLLSSASKCHNFLRFPLSSSYANSITFVKVLTLMRWSMWNPILHRCSNNFLSVAFNGFRMRLSFLNNL